MPPNYIVYSNLVLSIAVKRKSTGGGDATDSKPEEGATPEKKAKLDEAKVVA